MVEQVAMCRGLRRLVIVAAAERRDARQAMTDIEGIRDLPELTVADAVDAGGDLLFNDLVDRCGQTLVEGGLIEVSAGLTSLEELQQLRRARQAADMCGQDAVGAELHLLGSSYRRHGHRGAVSRRSLDIMNALRRARSPRRCPGQRRRTWSPARNGRRCAAIAARRSVRCAAPR